MNGNDKYFSEIIARHEPALKACRICPRNCGVNRLAGRKGVCGAGSGFGISSICLHTGEEPVISGEAGICNVFFSRCNLACIYCQNWQISRNRGEVQESDMSLDAVVKEIILLLDQGCHAVGFVSPSHYIPQVKMIIEALRAMDRRPVFVYNTNCYDEVSEIRGLEDYIDIYLPDFKYADNKLAAELSGVSNYREKALAALKEMHHQKGSTLIMDEKGRAEKGLIIRHLILPGNTGNSIEVLNLLADEISTSVTLSLMSQYWPVPEVAQHPDLSRCINPEEYNRVVDEMERLGFYKGWIQELESHHSYRPDFSRDHPFER